MITILTHFMEGCFWTGQVHTHTRGLVDVGAFSCAQGNCKVNLLEDSLITSFCWPLFKCAHLQNNVKCALKCHPARPLALGQRVGYKYSTCSAVGPGLQRLLGVFHFAAKAILFSYFYSWCVRDELCKSLCRELFIFPRYFFNIYLFLQSLVIISKERNNSHSQLDAVRKQEPEVHVTAPVIREVLYTCAHVT